MIISNVWNVFVKMVQGAQLIKGDIAIQQKELFESWNSFVVYPSTNDLGNLRKLNGIHSATFFLFGTKSKFD